MFCVCVSNVLSLSYHCPINVLPFGRVCPINVLSRVGAQDSFGFGVFGVASWWIARTCDQGVLTHRIMEADTLFSWFLSVVSKQGLSPVETGKLREQVQLAIKNRNHCDKLSALDDHLNKNIRGRTELSSVDDQFDIRFCARTRFTLSTGIYRSWSSFVDHLSNRLEEIGIQYVASDRIRETISQLLWEGTAHKTNGWSHNHNCESIECTVASRIDQLVSLPIVQGAMEELASLQSHLTLGISALISYETRCSHTRVVDESGREVVNASRSPCAGTQLRIGDADLNTIRRWHKKVHASDAKVIALERIFEQQFVVSLLRDAEMAKAKTPGCRPLVWKHPGEAASCFSSLLLIKPRLINAEELNALGLWLFHHASSVRMACGREMARIEQLSLHKSDVSNWCWHDVDIRIGGDVHQPPPWTRIVLQAPNHLSNFANMKDGDRLNVGRSNVATQHCLPAVTLAHIVSMLLRHGHLPLSDVGNGYLMRVAGCEFVSYEGRLRDVLTTELKPFAEKRCAPLPVSWRSLEAKLSESARDRTG